MTEQEATTEITEEIITETPPAAAPEERLEKLESMFTDLMTVVKQDKEKVEPEPEKIQQEVKQEAVIKNEKSKTDSEKLLEITSQRSEQLNRENIKMKERLKEYENKLKSEADLTKKLQQDKKKMQIDRIFNDTANSVGIDLSTASGDGLRVRFNNDPSLEIKESDGTYDVVVLDEKGKPSNEKNLANWFGDQLDNDPSISKFKSTGSTISHSNNSTARQAKRSESEQVIDRMLAQGAKMGADKNMVKVMNSFKGQ